MSAMRVKLCEDMRLRPVNNKLLREASFRRASQGSGVEKTHKAIDANVNLTIWRMPEMGGDASTRSDCRTLPIRTSTHTSYNDILQPRHAGVSSVPLLVLLTSGEFRGASKLPIKSAIYLGIVGRPRHTVQAAVIRVQGICQDGHSNQRCVYEN
ncbi:hypothetical protein BD309DRAFT_399996 [Dichomitus squalens]|nr:hypothetical protein BD309DRAFT_399996 [Dichomitus squalens]